MTEDATLLTAAEELSREFYDRSDEIENARRLPPDVSRKMGRRGSIDWERQST